MQKISAQKLTLLSAISIALTACDGNTNSPTSSSATAMNTSSSLAMAASSSSEAASAPISPSSISASSSSIAAAQSVTFEEQQPGFCRVDGSIDANHDGFSGMGFANVDNSVGQSIVWSIDSAQSQSVTVEIRFANGGTTARSGSLLINNGSSGNYTVNLDPTAGWADWQTESLTIDLVQGQNSLALTSTGEDGLANIDYIKINGNGISAGACNTAPPISSASSQGMSSSSTPAMPPVVDDGQLKAFPTAEGYGKMATGGRGGEVYIVTNTNASGPGSLGDALSKSGRTVVFEVSGTIKGRFNIPNNTTIAGQTAPGDGITIFGQMTHGSNVIVRYIRVRFDGNGDRDAFGTRYKENVIVDHVSASWSRDEVMSIYHGKNVTIQWTMVSEACPNQGTDSHRFGAIWGNDYATYHHNLIAHNENRTPRWASGAGHNDYRNNVTYNWGYGGSYGGERVQNGTNFIGSWINLVANYYKPGPGSKSQDRIVAPSARNPDANGIPDNGNWFVADNYVVGSPNTTNDNWIGVKGSEFIKMDTAWDAMPINQETAEQAYESVLAHVGASKPKRDSIDERIISDVRNGTATLGRDGFVNCPEDTQLPTLNSTPPPADTDRDGMPDSWELANGLDPANPADRNIKDAIGYTMLENYLNSID